MGMHLLIVGEHRQPDTDIDPVFASAKETETFKKRRCASPSELVKTVRDVARETGRMIDILDLYDHGAPGHLYLGDQKVFMQDGTGRSIARALRPLLTTDARVRLLGCDTAVGSEGQALLRMLREELGSAVIYGTIASTAPYHFGRDGFDRQWDDTLLFSSTEAATRGAPGPTTRTVELGAWYTSNLT